MMEEESKPFFAKAITQGQSPYHPSHALKIRLSAQPTECNREMGERNKEESVASYSKEQPASASRHR
jgi:hypothetical protein